jgi:hypothetical protein
MKGEAVFAFADLWHRWSSSESHDVVVGPDFHAAQKNVESFTILRTTPNGLLQDVRDRMLVILHCNHYETWLAIEKARLKELLLPFEAGADDRLRGQLAGQQPAERYAGLCGAACVDQQPFWGRLKRSGGTAAALHGHRSVERELYHGRTGIR